MSSPPISDDVLRAAVDAVVEHGTKAKAAKALGIPSGTLYSRLRVAQRRGISGAGVLDQTASAPPEGWTEEVDGDYRTIDSRSVGITTLDEALEHANVDPAVWEVERYTVNSWPVAGKRKTPKGEQLWDATLFQVRVKLKRRVSKPVEDAAALLASRLKPRVKPAKRLPKRKDGRLVVCGLYDVHLGQLVWEGETGHSDDVRITEARVRRAVDAIVARIDSERPGRVIVPFGNDFCHFENRRGETEAGTKVEADTRYAKVIEVAEGVCEYIIDRFTSLGCGVEVLYVPCNHSPLTSFHLCRWLDQRYKHDDRVTVDASAPKYKFRTHGATLLGFAHGHGMDRRRLYDVMAEHAREKWSGTICGEWHIGHFHTRQNLPPQAPSMDSRASVMIRQNPALSETSAYAHELGYAGHVPAVSAWVYDARTGYCGEMFEAMPQAVEA